MGKIKIEDLPEDIEVTQEEMKKITGGGLFVKLSRPSYLTRFISPGDDKFTQPLD